MTPEDEVALMVQEYGDSQRTLICEPDRADAITQAVRRMGLSGVYTVRSSIVCPPGKVLVLDEQALQASMNQTFQRAAKQIRFRP